MGSGKFWGEKEVPGRRGVGEREKKTILWLQAKWRDNSRVRGPGQGTEWAEAVKSGRQVELDERKES